MRDGDEQGGPERGSVAPKGGASRGAGAWRARLIAAAAAPCILALTLWQIVAAYNEAITNAEALAEALARVAEEHFVGRLGTIEHVLSEVVELAGTDGVPPPQAFAELGRARLRQYAFLRNVFVVGPQGRILQGTHPNLPGVDVHDRGYFAVPARDSRNELFIDSPVQSRALPVTSIILSRGLRDSAGAFKGVAAIAIDPAVFEDELRSVRVGDDGFATLLRRDGTILGRVPDGEKWVGKVVGDGPAMRASANAPNGVIRGEGAVDGTSRILAFRRVANYPLVVVVGVRLKGILARWQSDSMLHAGVGLILSAIVAAMAIWSDRSQAERLRAQQALAASEARYRLLIDQSPLGIVQASASGEAVYVNQRWLALAGRSLDTVLGRKWCDAIDERDRSAVLKGWSAMARDGGVFTGEMRTQDRSGGERWLRVHAAPLDMSDSGAGFVATFGDISAARQVEQNLRLSEEKFGKAFQASPEALVISTQARGRYVEVNNAFCRLLGYSRAELMGRDAVDLGVWAEPKDRDLLVRMAAETGQAEEFETRLKRKDGALITVLVSAQPIVVAGENCLLFICRDVTERREMESHARSLVAKLNASNMELEQFAYVASHDLQEPLRMIAGYAQLLSRRYRDKLDSDADEFIDFLVDGAKRMQVMIRDLLEFSRVERQGGVFEPFESDAAMQDALRNLTGAIRDADGAVEVGPLPRVSADRSQFVRLFQNLIGNALKYRHPDRAPKIVVSAEVQGADAVFTVADNGIGIEPQYFERIFLVFQRLHTRDKFEGTGIGLAICKKIAERHGGRLWVESTPGEGSAFKVSLPVA